MANHISPTDSNHLASIRILPSPPSKSSLSEPSPFIRVKLEEVSDKEPEVVLPPAISPRLRPSSSSSSSCSTKISSISSDNKNVSYDKNADLNSSSVIGEKKKDEKEKEHINERAPDHQRTGKRSRDDEGDINRQAPSPAENKYHNDASPIGSILGKKLRRSLLGGACMNATKSCQSEDAGEDDDSSMNNENNGDGKTSTKSLDSALPKNNVGEEVEKSNTSTDQSLAPCIDNSSTLPTVAPVPVVVATTSNGSTTILPIFTDDQNSDLTKTNHSIQYVTATANANAAATPTEQEQQNLNLTASSQSTLVNVSGTKPQNFQQHIESVPPPVYPRSIGIPDQGVVTVGFPPGQMYSIYPPPATYANTFIYYNQPIPPGYCPAPPTATAMATALTKPLSRRCRIRLCTKCKNIDTIIPGLGTLEEIAEWLVQRRIRREERRKDDKQFAERRSRECGYNQISDDQLKIMLLYGSEHGFEFPIPTKFSESIQSDGKKNLTNTLYGNGRQKKSTRKTEHSKSRVKEDEETQPLTIIERILLLEGAGELNKTPLHEMKNCCECCQTHIKNGSFKEAMGRIYLSRYCFDPVKDRPNDGYLPLDEKQKKAMETIGKPCGADFFPIPTKMKHFEGEGAIKSTDVAVPEQSEKFHKANIKKDTRTDTKLDKKTSTKEESCESSKDSCNVPPPASHPSTINPTGPTITHQPLLMMLMPNPTGPVISHQPFIQNSIGMSIYNQPLVPNPAAGPAATSSIPVENAVTKVPSAPMIENIVTEVPSIDRTTAENDICDESSRESFDTESLNVEVEEGETFSLREQEILNKMLK